MELVIKHKELKLDLKKATKSDLIKLEDDIKKLNKEFSNEIKRQLLNKYDPYIKKLEQLRSLDKIKKSNQFDNAIKLIALYDNTGDINKDSLISKYKLNNSMSESNRTKNVISALETEYSILEKLPKELKNKYCDKLSLDELTVKQYNYLMTLTEEQKIKLDKFLKKEGIEYV